MDKAIIYNRVSTTDQHPELQLKECREFCEKNEWEVVDVLQENKSAFKDDSKRDKFQEMLSRAEKNEFQHIVVWNMDRFSRQPEDEVLDLVNRLSIMYGVDVNAVHGDLWSELVTSIAKVKNMGFIGKAISEFLEKIIRGIEFQRAHRESQTKSERISLAVVKEEGKPTVSYKGNKWGRKSLPKNIINKIINLRERGDTIQQIARQVTYTDKNNNRKNVSVGSIHKLLKEYYAKKD